MITIGISFAATTRAIASYFLSVRNRLNAIDEVADSSYLLDGSLPTILLSISRYISVRPGGSIPGVLLSIPLNVAKINQ